MQIGACGVACGVCGYLIKGICSGCVAGTDENAAKVLDTQKKELGYSCPVLECAITRKVGYCLKDCDEFPCDLLYRGLPYSQEFLDFFKKT